MAMRVIRIKEVQKMVGVSRGTIYSFIKEGKFPNKIHIGGRSVGFLLEDIEEWIMSRVVASNQTGGAA